MLPEINSDLLHLLHCTEYIMDKSDLSEEQTFKFVVHNFSKIDETVFSPPCMIRNLSWRLLIKPYECRTDQPMSIGIFLQCEGKADSPTWTCQATAELRLLNWAPEGEACKRNIAHLFSKNKKNWGFSRFMARQAVLDPSNGFIKDDTIVLEVCVTVDAARRVSRDSKQHTGYVGLKNQGATCFMNSLLQSLYFTNELRRAVYLMPTERNDENSVGLALQRVFYKLQFSAKKVSTKHLTRSFGWTKNDCQVQRDVQEFCRYLLNTVDNEMSGTCVEGTIQRLFEGKMLTYTRCKHVNYVSEMEETFYDLQLVVKGKKSVYESLKEYCKVQTLDGVNSYNAGMHGLQEAERGIEFVSFPPVLHLHLMRSMYEKATRRNIKIKDKFQFPERLTLNTFLHKPETTPSVYHLHTVVVHYGKDNAGHYVAFIKPILDSKFWWRFDDSTVSPCTRTEAITQNFGGKENERAGMYGCAYMLAYIRQSELSEILAPVCENDIPDALTARLNDERESEKKKVHDAKLDISAGSLESAEKRPIVMAANTGETDVDTPLMKKKKPNQDPEQEAPASVVGKLLQFFYRK